MISTMGELLKRDQRASRLEHLNGDCVAAILGAPLAASLSLGLWLLFRLIVRRAADWAQG